MLPHARVAGVAGVCCCFAVVAVVRVVIDVGVVVGVNVAVRPPLLLFLAPSPSLLLVVLFLL